MINMKSFMRAFAFLLLLQFTPSIQTPKASAQVSIDFQVFYDDLSPYGNWIYNSDYGYVWVPDVDDGFSPYHTNGYWIFTDEGWTWISNYSWGWAPFHYGRWYNDNHYGPIWVPGYEWGPGWVSWRHADGYYGWAPIGPGISIDFAYSSVYNRPYEDWTFIRDRDFGRQDINNYFISVNNTNTIYMNSTVIDNFRSDQRTHTRFNAGPDRRDVEQRSGRSYAPVTLTASNDRQQRVDNRELRIFRPDVKQNNSLDNRNVPKKITEVRNLKPARERTADHNNTPAAQPVIPVRTQQSPDRIPVTPRNKKDQRNERPVINAPVRITRPERLETPRQQPARIPQRDQPVSRPNREQQERIPKKDQPVQTPKREQPAQAPKREQPVRQQPAAPQKRVERTPPQQRPVLKEQNQQKAPQQKPHNRSSKKDR